MLVDRIDATYDPAGRPDRLLRSGTTQLADFNWNPDGTLLSRVDGDAGALGTTSLGYDWADRLTSVDLPDTFSTAVPTFAWRLDGLVGSRTWNTGAAADFGYDAAKRLVSITKGSLSFGQAYDRDGNVTSETRALGFTGDAGAGTQTFTYDALNRVTGASGLGVSRSYAYDLDGNRTRKTVGPDTWLYTYDRTDQLSGVQKNGGVPGSSAYDSRGNLTGRLEDDLTTTAYAYDVADRLVSIDRPGTGSDATLAYDALDRIRTGRSPA